MKLYYHPASTTSRIVQLFALDQITLADYMGVEMTALGGLIGCSYAAYPNIDRWLKNMKGLKSWVPVHEVIDGFGASLKGQSFVAL